MAAKKKPADAATDTAASSEAAKVVETAPKTAPAKTGVWVEFDKEAPPTKERFVYVRELEGGSKIAAFAEVSTDSEGKRGMWVDGLSGLQPMPSGPGHRWMVLDLS